VNKVRPQSRTRFDSLTIVSRIVLFLVLANGGFASAQPRITNRQSERSTAGRAGEAAAAMPTVTPRLTGPSAAAPLAARLTVETSRPTGIMLDVRGKDEAWRVASMSELRSEHVIPILGLAPASEYLVENIRVVDSNGSSTISPDQFKIRTAALPPDFPTLTAWQADAGRIEPGYLLTSVLRGRPGRSTAHYTLIVDRRGTPRWFCHLSMLPVEQQPAGTLFGLAGNLFEGYPCEMDVYGGILRTWRYAPPGRTSHAMARDGRVHHEAVPLSNGNVLTFSEVKRVVPNFPTSDRNPNAPRGDRLVATDPIVELRSDGTVANTIDLLSILDPYRFGYDTVRAEGYQDWVHGNAITYVPGKADDPDDDAILVSLRNQDAILKLAYPSGRLIWILGTHSGWKPRFQQYLLTPAGDSDFEWPFHQHSPTLLPNNHLLLFDNGNHRATPFVTKPQAPENSYSRAVQYAIDEETRRIMQVWQFGGRGTPPSERIFSPFSGDADRLPETNNVLITFACPEYIGGKHQQWNRPQIVEVSHRGERLFVMQAAYEDADASIYRTAIIKSIYPPGFQVSPLPSP
jgi:arylsulfate sulfotransferase